MAKDKRRYQMIHQKLRHMSEDQGGLICTLPIAAVKRGPRLTMEINRYGLRYRSAEIRRYDSILVVIDRLTKMTHFIGCSQDLDARQFANLLMKVIVRLHRLPQNIITDRGTLFTSYLWQETMG